MTGACADPKWSLRGSRNRLSCRTISAETCVLVLARSVRTGHRVVVPRACPARAERRSRTSMASATGAMVTHSVSSPPRSEEHTSELQSLMRISYAVFCLKKKKTKQQQQADQKQSQTHKTKN